MELTKQLIRDMMSELRKQQRKYKVYQDYYRGNHDILRNYKFNEQRANMKIVVNFFKKFIHDEVAYSLGNPVNYIHKDNNSKVIDEIDTNFSHWQNQHDQKLAIRTAIYGHAYELDYLNGNGEFKSTVLTPMNTFVVESVTAEKDVEVAIHHYKKNKYTDVEMIDVYHESKIYTYQFDSIDRMYLVNEREHIFGKPPIRVNEYNEERQSLLDDIKSLIDGYNNIVSDLTNEISDFRQAFLKVIGAKLDPEEAKKMKESGIIQVDKSSEIEYLTKEINDQFVHNQLSNFEEKIYKLASHIDTNEKLQSNLSGVALRSRMIALENKCSLIQGQMASTIKDRLSNFFRYLQVVEDVTYDFRRIKLKHTMNIPQDLAMLSDMISKLKDTVSQRTLLSVLPFVDNPDHELEQFRAERDRMMENSIDLDSRSGNNE